jgi:uncharacterized protein (TIGR02266 family)
MGREVTKDRQHVRASVALTARCSDPAESRQLEGICQNLSRSGMFLGTPRPAAVGALLKFECELVDGTTRVRGTARVMWVRREADGAGRPAGMGLRFLNLETGYPKVDWAAWRLEVVRDGVAVRAFGAGTLIECGGKNRTRMGRCL